MILICKAQDGNPADDFIVAACDACGERCASTRQFGACAFTAGRVAHAAALALGWASPGPEQLFCPECQTLAETTSPTHAILVRRAERWLRNTRRCGVVLTEASGTGGEIPDAIGWNLGYCPMSILVECKASRADFLRDRKKTFRHESIGDMALGRFRYFLAPPGLVMPADLPSRWGLLEARRASIRHVVKAKRWDLDTGGSSLGLRKEMAILLSELRKVQIVRGGGTLMDSRAARRVAEMVGREA